MKHTLYLSLPEILIAYAVISALILLIIVGFKFVLSKKSSAHIASNQWQQFVIKNRTKYKFADVFRLRFLFLRTGLLLSMAFVFFAFQWTSFEKTVYIPDDLYIDPLKVQETPRTMDPPPVKPPPAPPEVVEVPDEEIIEDQPDFLDESIEDDFVNEEPVEEENKAPEKPVKAPAPPPEEEIEIDEIIHFAEQMPRFPGCENIDGDHKTKQQCAEKKMLEFIYKHLRYPTLAAQNNIEGRCVAQFVIDKSGMVSNINIMRDPGAGLGEASQKVLLKMNEMGMRWTPGKQNGKTVKVMYTIPIMFRLEH